MTNQFFEMLLNLIYYNHHLYLIVFLNTLVLTKLLAGAIGGKIVGMSTREALGLGCVLNGRGVMELVVAGIAYQKGFIGPTLFSTLVLMGIITTFLTPLLFKRVFPGDQLEHYRRQLGSDTDPPVKTGPRGG